MPDEPKIGRPTKLTRQRHDRIVSMIKAGSYAIVAARANGIHPATFHAWTARGRDAERGDDDLCLNPDEQPYADFHDDVKVAEAEAEVASVMLIQRTASNGTWQAAAWLLERKYSDRWGRKDHLRQEVSGPAGGPVEVDAKAELLTFLMGRRDPETDEVLDAEVVEDDAPVEEQP